MSIENVSKDTDKIIENVLDSESEKTRDKIDNLSKMSLILRDKNKGQNILFLRKKNIWEVSLRVQKNRYRYKGAMHPPLVTL